MTEAKDAGADFARELERLRQSYEDSLPAQIAGMEALARGLSGAETDRSSVVKLHHRLHKLAGSGGTFGFAGLSERARALESRAADWLAAPPESRDRTALADLAGGIRALHDVLGGSARASEAPAAQAQAVAGGTIELWLVEGDAQLGRELSQLLGQFGYKIRLFDRFGDVEGALAAGRPDAIIMSASFPAEGIDATEAVALRPALRACPLLFTSASGDFQLRARAARLGAAGFLLTPIDLPRLVDRLERIFEERWIAPYRVLIVDDDVELAAHYRLVLLAAGMEAEALNEPAEVIERIASFRPELVLLDVNMPGHSGPELATVIRHHDEWLGLPIVYLSAETNLDLQLQALGRGADDFITKPISDGQLVAAVRVRALRSRQLADLMSKDSLTGLLKHSRIKEELEVEIARSRRSGKPMSVAMVDIDHFKSVNDTYGHAVGDRVIKSVAHLLRQRLRKTDVVGRYGGEEFAALLPECDEETSRQLLDDIRLRFAALRFQHGGREFGCTLSVGIASSGRHPQDSGSALLVAADTALYAAKHGGRNQVRTSISPL